MTQQEEKEPAFKVVDRRRFNEDGVSITNGDEEKSQTKPVQQAKNEPEAKTSSERPPLNFSLFIQSLTHQAMMGLGIVPWPDSGLVRTELAMAKETIDILQIIKDKTVNNLSKEEAHLLESVLYQLQVAFVEITKRPPVDSGSIIAPK